MYCLPGGARFWSFEQVGFEDLLGPMLKQGAPGLARSNIQKRGKICPRTVSLNLNLRTQDFPTNTDQETRIALGRS